MISSGLFIGFLAFLKAHTCLQRQTADRGEEQEEGEEAGSAKKDQLKSFPPFTLKHWMIPDPYISEGQAFFFAL